VGNTTGPTNGIERKHELEKGSISKQASQVRDCGGRRDVNSHRRRRRLLGNLLAGSLLAGNPLAGNLLAGTLAEGTRSRLDQHSHPGR